MNWRSPLCKRARVCICSATPRIDFDVAMSMRWWCGPWCALGSSSSTSIRLPFFCSVSIFVRNATCPARLHLNDKIPLTESLSQLPIELNCLMLLRQTQDTLWLATKENEQMTFQWRKNNESNILFANGKLNWSKEKNRRAKTKTMNCHQKH